MTAQAPPTKARKATRTRALTLAEVQMPEDAELVRWTPEEVVDKRWLPYKSARVLREKAYKDEVHCHKDGGVVTFTAEDIRRENARTAIVPRSLTGRRYAA
ncbi:hypothetical protein [Streptomyces lateritius]|uniref:hypothetical protein n=1 Tax=Streptomyces lateritius TaxID=67313 RepID=UPI001C8B9544|nr:hypothetical protein [Streptomyces lateritius]MBX9425493.1 hypothetical protein [Streptomyces lateritius]